MTGYWYRLELLPTEDGREYYNNVEGRSAENAGFDLFLAQNYDAATMVANAEPTLLDLGTSARMMRVWSDGREEEVHYWLCPRSSIIKTGMMMANSQGVIDSSYRGTLKAPVWVVAPAVFKDGLTKGSRYFQIVAPDMGWIHEVRVVQSLSVTQRGPGGFGSTGN